MQPTDLAFNQALGIVAAPAGAEHVLELPFTPLVHNHVGTMHAAAQFALAEAASAACLQRDFGATVGQVFAVVRGADFKYRQPATATLRAFARPDGFTRTHLAADLANRARSTAVVLVELRDPAGARVSAGAFHWFIARPGASAAPPPEP